jgi:very-short-patch-repair endonuclease
MSRNRTNGKFRNRSGEILFIDARNMGHLINRRTKVLSEEDIDEIAETYHNWRNAPQPPKGGVKSPSVLKSANPALYGELSKKAKEMRNNPTKAEQMLWERLKNKQLGIKFRQQHIINKFIVDFCSIEKSLVIEVDGEIHEKQKEADAQRSKTLEKEGFNIIRFKNNEVINNIELVLSSIEEALKKSPSGDLGAYEDIKGFCNSTPIERVKELDYVLTPGRYVGLAEEEDDFDFKERFNSLKSEFDEQLKEEERLNKMIAKNLAKIKLNDEK